ncbi:hypothetical protein [Streptomyces sp. WM6378]|uniref:hypothetical protein n=1 Tax=Streptomyces sp. WM6378 TaxID=1415557 RepID=UPI0006ADA916|nr:hypothetical protein [Streptomyces sp. WM6378]KOU53986.1 hypothetical protein ADK54_02790 [Streptomyces sp. WM6378]
MPRLVSAAARTTPNVPAGQRVPLAERAHRQHDGDVPAVVGRVTDTAGNAPTTSSFQSTL